MAANHLNEEFGKHFKGRIHYKANDLAEEWLGRFQIDSSAERIDKLEMAKEQMIAHALQQFEERKKCLDFDMPRNMNPGMSIKSNPAIRSTFGSIELVEGRLTFSP